MEYILQRQALRHPLTDVKFPPMWAVSDLNGGCETWHRFEEKQLPPDLRKAVYRKEVEQFQSSLEKEALAKSMWEKRVNESAELECWWVETPHNDSHSAGIEETTGDAKSKYAFSSTTSEDVASTVGYQVYDDEMDRKNNANIGQGEEDDDDDDDDDNGTIYSRALPGPSPPHQASASSHLPKSSTHVHSNVTKPCTLQSMSLMYSTLNWLSNVEDAESTRVAALAQSAPRAAAGNHLADQLAFREFLTQYVEQSWSRYENERLLEVINKSRTLGSKTLRTRKLPICDWKRLPLYDSYEAHKTYSMSRPTTGRCAYERTPTIVVTNEDGEHFRLLEVIKILTEKQITEIRRRRDVVQELAQREVEANNLSNLAAIEGQTPLERRTVEAARAWWASEQQKRNATYIDWQHAEAQEHELLMRQIERDAEQHLRETEISEAKALQKHYHQKAKAVQTQHLAKLKLKLDKDDLRSAGTGRYVGREYRVEFDSRMLNTFLTHRSDIESVALAIKRNATSRHATTAEAEKRDWLYQAEMDSRDSFLRVLRRREDEIRDRHAHQRNEIVVNWIEGDADSGERVFAPSDFS